MKQTLTLLYLAFYLANTYSIAPLSPEQPALVINIVVDNLSIQDIERNRHLLSTEGILKLVNEGTLFNNAYYPYSCESNESDYTSIVTATTPRHHGIIAKRWYDRNKEEYQSSIANNKHISIGLNKQQKSFDASNILCSTIGDELKLNTGGKSKVYSVSLKPEAAVLLAGHAADAAFWLDDKEGQFITSDYYTTWLPDWTETFNSKKLANFYLTQEWTLNNDPDLYNYPNIKKDNLFPIILSNQQNNNTPYRILSSTPMGNMLLTDFTLELIKEEELGKDEISDLLFLNVGDPSDNNLNISNNSIAKGDYIIRLDKEIERILRYLDKEVGTHRYLLSLVSTQITGPTKEELQTYKVPTGEFNPDRSKALLNSYLMALHGQGEWVSNLSNQQIYLNKQLIEKSKLDFTTFQNQVAEFMEGFEGIKYALPAHQLKYADFHSGDFKEMQESYFYSRSGDISLIFHPGWSITTDNKGTSHKNKSCSLVLYGWKSARNTNRSPLPINNYAIILAELLNITQPNNSTNHIVNNRIELK